MSLFDHLESIASATIDRVNADPFILTPMLASPNGRGGSDPARPVIEARGVFDLLPAMPAIEHGARSTNGGSNAYRARVSGEEPSLSIDRRIFPDAASEPRQGDVVEFPAHPHRGLFEVVKAERDGMSRLLLILART